MLLHIDCLPIGMPLPKDPDRAAAVNELMGGAQEILEMAQNLYRRAK
jgi:hypothetical protein